MMQPYIQSGNVASNDPPSTDTDDAEKGRRSASEIREIVFSRVRDRSPQDNQNLCFCCGIFWIVAVIVGVILLIVSLKKVEDTQYGVEYARYSKKLDDAAKSGGLFLGPPGYKFIKFPSTYITVDFDDRTCVSRDGLRVGFSVTFQYRMTEENMVPAIVNYRNFQKWALIVEAAGLSAIHHSCAEFIISEFQSKRGEIQSTMEDNLRLKFEGNEATGVTGVYALAVSLQLRNLVLPAPYTQAIQDKQSAEEEIALAQNERKQSLTIANTELLRAQEEARKILDTARNEANVTLTEANFKAQETSFAFAKEAETIVDVKNSLQLTTNGVLAYLANSLLSEVGNLKVTTAEPARLSRSDEL